MKSICNVKDCNRKIHAKGLCHKHYLQFRKGGIKERTQYDPNKIIVEGQIAYIVLYDKDCNEKTKAIIDTEDIPKVKEYKWYLHSKGYVATDKKGYTILIHRVINNTPEGKLTDHKNRNKLDNRKCNLRTCNTFQNMANRKAQCNSSSGYRGIFYHKMTKKWEAEIHHNNKKEYLGLFNKKEEAIEAYNEAAEKYHKDFACLNKEN